MVRSMNTAGPEQASARKLESINIINALRRGTVPASGLERVGVGLDVEEGVIAKQARLCRPGRRGYEVHPGGLWIG